MGERSVECKLGKCLLMQQHESSLIHFRFHFVTVGNQCMPSQNILWHKDYFEKQDTGKALKTQKLPFYKEHLYL